MVELQQTTTGTPARDRTVYLALALCSIIAINLARLLEPSPDGVGTHEQMGLPPCPFFHLTGIPCPSCGLTTSFAHAARLNFYASFIAQPFGLIAFCLAILSIPLSIYLAGNRRPWSELIHIRGIKVLIYALIALFVISWIYKIVSMSL
jgi:Protein of unknown function (DUF2752)